MKTLTVSRYEDFAIVKNVMTSMFETLGKLTVIVKKYERDKSSEQNRLYWMWVGIIANDLGYTKDELHMELKRMFLQNIYAADPIKHPGYAEMLAAAEQLGRYELINGITRLTSITTASVRNMSEYLNEIKNHATGLGIMLPLPEMQGIL
jgi:hypothetical protein